MITLEDFTVRIGLAVVAGIAFSIWFGIKAPWIPMTIMFLGPAAAWFLGMALDDATGDEDAFYVPMGFLAPLVLTGILLFFIKTGGWAIFIIGAAVALNVIGWNTLND